MFTHLEGVTEGNYFNDRNNQFITLKVAIIAVWQCDQTIKQSFAMHTENVIHIETLFTYFSRVRTSILAVWK